MGKQNRKKPKSLCQTCPNREDCEDPCNPSSCEFHPSHDNYMAFQRYTPNLFSKLESFLNEERRMQGSRT